MMARAIGDSDAGVTVLAYPHVTQVKIPDTGARFILASDGVWDSKVSQKQVVKIMRQNRLQKAASAVVRRVLASTGLADDTTALCVDILPPGVVCLCPPVYSHVQTTSLPSYFFNSLSVYSFASSGERG
jgi:serine/threonine protein phosphatase PrpC